MSRDQQLTDEEWCRGQLELRHRMRGWGAHVTDIDQIIVYDNRVPVAFLEFKRSDVRDPYTASVVALTNAARMAGLPAYLVRYTPRTAHPWQFDVEQLTDKLRRRFKLTEAEWVKWLADLRAMS